MLDVSLDHLGRRLTPSEAVGVLVHVGRELAALHEAGRGHGSAGRLTVGFDGRVRLAEAAGVGDPKADVLDLGHAVEVRLGHDVPELLRRLLATCRCPDPAGRPTAEELIRLALRIASPADVRRPAAHHRGAALAAGVLGLLALTLAVALGRAMGDGAERPTALPQSPARVSASPPRLLSMLPVAPRTPAPVPRSSPRAAPTPADWRAVVVDLDLARRRAWSAADPTALSAADLPGSPADRRDRRLVADLLSQGAHATGWAPTVSLVRPTSVSRTRAVLLLRDTLPGYALVSARGTAVHRVPARGARSWIVELRAVPAGWRIWDVRSVSRSVSSVR